MCFPRQETGREQGLMEIVGANRCNCLGAIQSPVTSRSLPPAVPCGWSLPTSELFWRRPAPTSLLPFVSLSNYQTFGVLHMQPK